MRRLTFGITAVVFLCTVLLPISKAATEEGKVYYVAVSDSAPLNVREKASLDSEELTQVERGTSLTSTGRTDGLWVEVYTDCYKYTYRSRTDYDKIGPLNGWVNIMYLSEEPPYEHLKGTITGCKKVNFRSEPVVTPRTELRKLKAETEVTLLAVFELDGTQWYRVRDEGGGRGFVMAEYVRAEP